MTRKEEERVATKVIKIEIPIETKDNTGQVVDSISEKMEGLDSAAKKAQKSMKTPLRAYPDLKNLLEAALIMPQKRPLALKSL